MRIGQGVGLHSGAILGTCSRSGQGIIGAFDGTVVSSRGMGNASDVTADGGRTVGQCIGSDS